MTRRAAAAARGNQELGPPGAEARSEREQQLATALALSDDELGFVWTLVARAVEPRVASYQRAIWGADAREGTSIAQHLALFPVDQERGIALLDVLDSRHPLRQAGIIETDDAVLDVSCRWTVPQRVWSFLRGDNRLDPLVARVGGLVTAPPRCPLSQAQGAIIDRLAEWLGRDALTIVLDGQIASGRRTAVALASERPVIAIDAALLSLQSAATAVRALRREVLLRGAVPVIANLDELWSSASPRDHVMLELLEQIAGFPTPLVITTREAGLDVASRGRATLRQSWPIPDVSTRKLLWELELANALPDAEHSRLAMRYALGAGGIASAVNAARHRAANHEGGGAPSFSEISAGVQDTIAERLGELAHRVEVRQQWDELVLPPETLDDVKTLIARIKHAHHVLETWNFKRKLARGTGVAALFSGPPGTGKTMVAGLIARELELELYQVDLSRIVSKWVGETEKQLAKVFDAAEAGHALLLFDEADALFAKRSAEVKSAVDRYANLEVNYLLQRVESFGGVVVLTTNLDTSIDPALRRRLASHIVFPAPERDEQLRLWESILATGAPLAADLRLADLVDEFPALAGANIRNAVLAAAFLASSEGTIITNDHLWRGARGEYRAMGHVLGKDSATR